MSLNDGDGFNSADASPSGSASPASPASPARSTQSAKLFSDIETRRVESLARAMAQMDAENLIDQANFKEAYRLQMQEEHEADMERVRVELTTIAADERAKAVATARSLPRPPSFGDESGIVKTMHQVLDPKVIAAFGRINQYDSQLNLAKQRENFVHMVSSSFSHELNGFSCWDSAMRGSEEMMDTVYSIMASYLENKTTTELDIGQSESQVVYAYFYLGVVVKLDKKEHHHFCTILHDLKTKISDVDTGSVLRYPVLPFYDKDNEAFMPHKYLPKALWHHACEILYQALLKFYRQQEGPQLPGYEEIKALGNSYHDGGKYAAAWAMIERFNGRNTAVDFVTVQRAMAIIEYNPKTHNFLLFLKALQSYRTELVHLDPREPRITDEDLLERSKNALIRAFALGDYRHIDNDNFNNGLANLAEDLVRVRTADTWRAPVSQPLSAQHAAAVSSFGSLYAYVQLLAQRTNTNVSEMSVPISYIPETSTEFSQQSVRSKGERRTNHRAHVTQDADDLDQFGHSRNTSPYVLTDLDDEGATTFNSYENSFEQAFASEHQGRRAYAPTRNDRTDTRRPHFRKDGPPPSANTWDSGRRSDLRGKVDGRHVDP